MAARCYTPLQPLRQTETGRYKSPGLASFPPGSLVMRRELETGLLSETFLVSRVETHKLTVVGLYNQVGLTERTTGGNKATNGVGGTDGLIR